MIHWPLVLLNGLTLLVAGLLLYHLYQLRKAWRQLRAGWEQLARTQQHLRAQAHQVVLLAEMDLENRKN